MTTVRESTTEPSSVSPRTRTMVPRVAAFTAAVTQPTAADVPLTYRPGCPVGPGALRMVKLTYWGFDNAPHSGRIVVAASVAVRVVAVFQTLYERRFPIRRMEPEDGFGGSDPASMLADNTSGFNCRNAVAPGRPTWSAHAYGTAIDVDPVENPYLEGGVVQPANGAPFVDRTRARPGMAGTGTVLNDAFAAVGWQWGGRWNASPDYQHFSADGG
jgi:hypothetical protein